MLKRSVSVAACGTLFAAALAAPSIAAPQDFVGTWVNVDSNTRGITRFVVTAPQPKVLRIQVFGQCSPTDCNWGTTQLTTYGTSVQDADSKSATATYNKSFANSFLALSLRGNKKQMMLQSFTQFTDNSGRQNYFAQYGFKKL